MRYTRGLISFVVIAMVVGFGFLTFGISQANAGTAPCSLGIEKVAIPESTTQFDFSITGDIVVGFSLSDPGEPTIGFGLGLGDIITVTEDVPPGWELESIECTEGQIGCGQVPCLNITIDEAANSITAECIDNDTGSCTFTNVRVAPIVPTLSQWGLIAMAGVLGIIAFVVFRRRKATA